MARCSQASGRRSRTNVRGRFYVPVIGLLLAAPGYLIAACTNQVSFALAGLTLYGFARAFCDSNMMPILCLVSDPRYRATGYGVLNSFACLVAGAMVYIGGVIRTLTSMLATRLNSPLYASWGAPCYSTTSSPKPHPTDSL